MDTATSQDCEGQMHFESPAYVPRLPFDPPDTVPIHEFLFGDNDQYGRYPKSRSKAPFTCGVTGRSHGAVEVAERIDNLARALAGELDLEVNEGSEMDKVIAIYSINTIDYLPLSWAIQRLNGVCFPIGATYSKRELTHQLERVRCQALFTCASLLRTAIEAADAVGMSRSRIFLLEEPRVVTNGTAALSESFVTVEQLVRQGVDLEALPALRWTGGQGARQTAFLCNSSGTSGLPKNVKISHRAVIANVLQFTAMESTSPQSSTRVPEMGLCLLPFGHAYALLLIAHNSIYRGDGVVVLQGFDLHETLQAIQDFQLNRLWLIPPMIVAMTKAASVVKHYDLSCVKSVVFGSSLLKREITTAFSGLVPDCRLLQAYGLTEASVLLSITNWDDNMFGSCGSIIPGVTARLVDPDNGKLISQHDTPGELHVQSPSLMLGYHDNQAATDEMLTEDGWLRTGDLVEMRKSTNGHDHVLVIDRIKELIKVRGMQVAPAELENFLLQHPAVADVAVVPFADDMAGELPRAYVVKSSASAAEDDDVLTGVLDKAVHGAFADYKQLTGGIEFLDALPKTASGKPQRGVVKAMARAKAQAVSKAREALQAREPVRVHVYEFDSSDEDLSDEDQMMVLAE